jgi:hypothetical protein
MVLLAMTRREWIHAVLRIARQGYYFVPFGAGSMAGGGIRWFGRGFAGIGKA